MNVLREILWNLSKTFIWNVYHKNVSEWRIHAELALIPQHNYFNLQHLVSFVYLAE